MRVNSHVKWQTFCKKYQICKTVIDIVNQKALIPNAKIE